MVTVMGKPAVVLSGTREIGRGVTPEFAEGRENVVPASWANLALPQPRKRSVSKTKA